MLYDVIKRYNNVYNIIKIIDFINHQKKAKNGPFLGPSGTPQKPRFWGLFWPHFHAVISTRLLYAKQTITLFIYL